MAAQATDYDFIFRDANDTYYYTRIKRGVEGSYQHRFVRTEVQQNLLNQSEVTAQKSRPDSMSMYQTSWAQGARWWKPLIAGGEMESFFKSNHMDTWSEPGKVVPGNAVTDAANTSIHQDVCMAVDSSGVVYAIGDTEVTDAGLLDVYTWSPAANAFARDTGQNSGVDDDDVPYAMVFDPNDGYFYIITSDPEICRFNPTSNVEDVAWITTGFTTYLGANIFLHNGNLMFYSGDRVYTVTKGTPEVVEVFNDGMGPEFLTGAGFAGSAPIYRKAQPKLAIATPEGIYYVKNTMQNGQPQPWVFRVDKDSAGNFIGNPLAPLPRGNVALSIAYHLGSVVISATEDWSSALINDADNFPIDLYHYMDGQPGAIGRFLDRGTIDETPWAIMGSSGPMLYIGGDKRLWVWDAVRGGLHMAFEWGTELTNGPYFQMAWVQDSAGDANMLFLGTDRLNRIKRSSVVNPDTVTNFGDDETHYTLESNYFDGGLPMEEKALAKAEMLFDPSTGTAGAPNQEWTLQLSVDDGAFSDIITAASSGVDYTSGYAASWASKTGRLFRYKVIYQTKTAVKNALKAIMVTFMTGEIVEEWELLLDGSEFRNVNNEVIDPDTFVTNMMALGEAETLIAIYDNYDGSGSIDITVDSADQRNTKLISLDIIKDQPTEPVVRIIVRESILGSSL